MAKNNKIIINRETLPKGKQGGVDWFNTKEIEIYFTDNEENYILKVEDVIKDKNKTIKVLLSYKGKPYKKYLQSGQILNGNLENIFWYFEINENRIRPFKLSDDGTYWIGITHDNIEFYFNGEYSEEIMKHNWRISNGYLVSMIKMENEFYKTVRLNRMVLGVTDRNILVNHCGGNKMDNRIEKLSISDHEDNMKELLPSILNNTGITGLMLNDNNKYKIQCTVNGVPYTHTYKLKDEALKDLLIIQRHYKYRHNENLYYLLDDVSENYINDLIDKVENKISTYKINPIICKNKFELSEDGSFYYMYDKNNNKCKISIEDIELVKQGNWRYTLNNGKEYFSGDIIWNGKRKGIFLHRFLMDLINPIYRNWYVDHLDSDGLNNIRDNLVITDAEGNGLNKKRKDIEFKYNTYNCRMIVNGKKYCKNFNTQKEAMKYRDKILAEEMKNRIEFKSREELDKYIEKQNMNKN